MTKSENRIPFGVRLPKKLVDEFDRATRNDPRGAKTRVVEEAIRKFVARRRKARRA